MRFSARTPLAALAIASALALTGCSSANTNDASASASASAAPSASDQPAIAPTTNSTSDPNQQVSLLDERAFLTAMQPLGFSCDASVIKAIEVSGTQIEFSSITCRRGSEPDIVLTLAANQNELELVTSASCAAATGTVVRSPIVVGGNWQLLSAKADRPLLEEIGKILQGKTMTIKELCA
ncbi:MAG: hypothetical protein KGL77_03895 [Actinomycetales bacterium]|nr:hypothetical protein [Actinomycetales bacterium]